MSAAEGIEPNAIRLKAQRLAAELSASVYFLSNDGIILKLF